MWNQARAGLRAAWTWLRKLPVGRWLGRVLKPAVADLIQEKGDELQAKVVASVEKKCPEEIDEHFDRWQTGLLKAVEWLPAAVRPRARNIIKEEGDRLQVRVREAACEHDATAVNAAFDGFQALLIQRLEAL